MQQPVYATFGKRLAATLIDSFWLGVLSYLPLKHATSPVIKGIMESFNSLNRHNLDDEIKLIMDAKASLALTFFVFSLSYKMYYAMWESSRSQATPGKMALGIKVVNMSGEKLSFGKAILRNLLKFFSSALIDIGFLMVLWDPKKQALHDKIAKTAVVLKN